MPAQTWADRYTQSVAVLPLPPGPTPLGLNGFLALTTGNITVIFRDSRASAPVVIPIVTGTVYPFAIDFFTAGPGTILGLR